MVHVLSCYMFVSTTFKHEENLLDTKASVLRLLSPKLIQRYFKNKEHSASFTSNVNDAQQRSKILTNSFFKTSFISCHISETSNFYSCTVSLISASMFLTSVRIVAKFGDTVVFHVCEGVIHPSTTATCIII